MTNHVLVKHMGHDGPWLLIKTRQEVAERRAYIKTEKPENERAPRLKLLKIVKGPLPPKLRESYAAREKADAAREKADAAWWKANAAWEKADAAREKADAAWRKANAAWWKANAAWWKAEAAWQKAIDSPEGIAFHKQVCGCAWTPKQPDILRGLD